MENNCRENIWKLQISKMALTCQVMSSSTLQSKYTIGGLQRNIFRFYCHNPFSAGIVLPSCCLSDAEMGCFPGRQKVGECQRRQPSVPFSKLRWESRVSSLLNVIHGLG